MLSAGRYKYKYMLRARVYVCVCVWHTTPERLCSSSIRVLFRPCTYCDFICTHSSLFPYCRQSDLSCSGAPCRCSHPSLCPRARLAGYTADGGCAGALSSYLIFERVNLSLSACVCVAIRHRIIGRVLRCAELMLARACSLIAAPLNICPGVLLPLLCPGGLLVRSLPFSLTTSLSLAFSLLLCLSVFLSNPPPFPPLTLLTDASNNHIFQSDGVYVPAAAHRSW